MISFSVDGRQLRFAGPVPWANAVLCSPAGRSVTVDALVSSMTNKPFCGVPEIRAVTTTSGEHLAVQLNAYATPSTSHACPTVGYPDPHVLVHLGHTLTEPSLVDATTGGAHRVLDPSTIPAIHAAIAHCNATELTWDEDTDIATRLYTGEPDSPADCRVSLQSGPRSAIDNLPTPRGRVDSQERVGAAVADGWLYADLHNHMWTFQWSPTPSLSIRLTVNTAPLYAFTHQQMRALADSVR